MKRYKRKFEEAKPSDKQDILVGFIEKYVDGYGSVGIENPKQYAKVLIDILYYILNDVNNAIKNPDEVFYHDVNMDMAVNEMKKVLKYFK